MDILGRNSNRTNNVQLLCFGSPLLDISARCEQTLLDQYGLKQDDCVRARAGHDPLFRRLFEDQGSRLSAGGSSQNAARVAKWTLREKGDVYFAGCTGRDDYERWMRTKLCTEGVIPLYVEVAEESTGVCACLLNADEKRSMIAKLGAGALFAPHHLRLDTVRERIRSSHCVYVEGYFLGHSPEAVFDLVVMCKPDKVFSLSLSAEYVCVSHTEALTKVLPHVDILFGNEAEVKALARALGGNDGVTAEESIRVVREHLKPTPSKPQLVVITRGSEPVIVDEGVKKRRYFQVPKDIRVVDSVGCGDALAGAFLATYIRTGDIQEAMDIGIKAAVEILQVAGCDPPFSKSLGL